MNKDLSFFEFATKHLTPLIIESLRVIGKSFSWALLGLIPGVIRYVQWLLTPYIVVFDPRYEKGQIDALEQSRHMTQGLWWKVAVLSLTPTLIELIFMASQKGQAFPLIQTPGLRFFSLLLTIPLNIFIAIYFSSLIVKNKTDHHGEAE